MAEFDLDVNAPDKVAIVLRAAAQAYAESAAEIEVTWQSKGAGRPWIKIAAVLEKAADRIDKILKE